MTESSSEKTKRILTGLLTEYRWNYQYSFFYVDIDNSKLLIDESNILKNKLKRKHPDIPFLICYRLHMKGRRVQAYATIFTTAKITGMFEYALDSLSEHNARYRSITPEKMEQAKRTIKRQALHDLDGFFGRRVRRYQVLNRSKLIPLQST